MADSEPEREAAIDGVRKRTAVDELVEAGDDRALAVARSIRHPWYRCQALSRAAHLKNESASIAVLEEAFRAAGEQTEINRIVVVSSWPLRELVRRDAVLAGIHLKRLIDIATEEPHGLRRADALYALCAAVYPAADLRSDVVIPLVGTLLSGRGWRIERLMHATAVLIEREYSELVGDLLAAHPPNRRRRKLEHTLHGRTDA